MNGKPAEDQEPSSNERDISAEGPENPAAHVHLYKVELAATFGLTVFAKAGSSGCERYSTSADVSAREKMRSSASEPLKNSPPSPFEATCSDAEPSVIIVIDCDVIKTRAPSRYVFVVEGAPSP